MLLYPADALPDMADHSHEPDPEKRVTAPMQAFGGREVGVGVAVLLVGLLLAYVVPALAI